MTMTGYGPSGTREHVTCLEREGGLLAAAAGRAGLDAAVPGCPGWQVRDVLAHTGYVHRWAAGFVAGQRTEPVATPGEADLLRDAPADDELLAWFAAGHAALVRTLREAAPDVQCWAFLPAPSPLAFWARRQAHETAIHRVDAEQSAGGAGQAGGASPLAARFAADGVDELLTGFLARSMRRGRWQGRTGVLGIHADDGAEGQADWAVVTGPDGSSVSRGTGPADCDVTGPAASLYLALWNRGPVDGLEIRGDPGFLAGIRDGLQIRW
jgi:uncharacterized protein (TIGR03083 family)